MKPAPPPYVLGNTEAERMDNALRKFLTVPKEAYPEGRSTAEAEAGKEASEGEAFLAIGLSLRFQATA